MEKEKEFVPQNVERRRNIEKSCWRLEDRHKEKVTGESVTVPDESMSIRDIVERYVRSNRMDETLYRQPSYDSGASFDSDDLEKVPGLDLFEKEVMYEKLRVDIENMKEKQKQENAAKLEEAEKGKASSGNEREQGRSGSDQAKERNDEERGMKRRDPGSESEEPAPVPHSRGVKRPPRE